MSSQAPASTVVVTGINKSTARKQIDDFFSFCGSIAKLDLTDDGPSTQKAVIEFVKPSAASTAVMLHGSSLDGAHLSVTLGASAASAATTTAAAATTTGAPLLTTMYSRRSGGQAQDGHRCRVPRSRLHHLGRDHKARHRARQQARPVHHLQGLPLPSRPLPRPEAEKAAPSAAVTTERTEHTPAVRRPSLRRPTRWPLPCLSRATTPRFRSQDHHHRSHPASTEAGAAAAAALDKQDPRSLVSSAARSGRA